MWVSSMAVLYTFLLIYHQEISSSKLTFIPTEAAQSSRATILGSAGVEAPYNGKTPQITLEVPLSLIIFESTELFGQPTGTLVCKALHGASG